MKKLADSSIESAEQSVSASVSVANKVIGFGGALVMLWIMSSVVMTLLNLSDVIAF